MDNKDVVEFLLLFVVVVVDIRFSCHSNLLKKKKTHFHFQVDFSQYDYPYEIWITIPRTEAIIKVTTIIPVVLFGVFGNFLLLNIISRNRALRTPTNFLLGNMAVADLATLLFCPVILLSRDLYQNYVLGAIGCNLEGFLQGMIGYKLTWFTNRTIFSFH